MYDLGWVSPPGALGANPSSPHIICCKVLQLVVQYGFFPMQRENLFSDVGGTAGLYVGYSLITACEFLILGLAAIRHFCRKYTYEYEEEEVTTNEQQRAAEERLRQERRWENVYGSTWDFNRGF